MTKILIKAAKSFIDGLNAPIDALYEQPRKKNFIEIPKGSLANDWEKIGGDFRVVIERYEKQNPGQARK